jgi:hypothetical protein
MHHAVLLLKTTKFVLNPANCNRDSVPVYSVAVQGAKGRGRGGKSGGGWPLKKIYNAN